jgi:hypothetical protein
LSKKKSCSPAVKINSPPQSAQVNNRSRNSMPLLPCYGKGRAPRGLIVAAPLCGLPSADDLLHFSDLKGAQSANAWNTSIPSQCEPVNRLSLLVPG